tara:strand:- start:82 stop:918 length:837 start_codon:yes stop_codon:yes gene_type:complete
MILNSYSKVNLSLIINKKLNNGLHDVQTHFCLINLFDKIQIYKIDKKKDNIRFKGKFAKDVKNSNNSIKSLLILLRRYNLISSFYKVIIYKNIPVYSGLGGGTSNAVSICNHLTKLKFSTKIFRKIEKKIGSDFKLFLYNQGFLKNLKTAIYLKKKFKLSFLLIYPNIKCSTKKIYSEVKTYSKKIKFSHDALKNKKNFINYISKSQNDLQSIVEKKYPLIEKILKKIAIQKGCIFSRISGSGSVCYGLFSSDKSAKVALKNIKKEYPKFFLTVAKTI